MVVYVGLEDVVEGGDVVVAELKNSVSSEFHGRPGFTVIRSSNVRQCPVVRCLGEIRERDELRDFGAEGDGEVEIERISGWKRVGRVGKARSTRSNTNPWTKSNKISTHQQITKKIWGYFWWGIFGIRTKTTKSS